MWSPVSTTKTDDVSIDWYCDDMMPGHALSDADRAVVHRHGAFRDITRAVGESYEEFRSRVYRESRRR